MIQQAAGSRKQEAEGKMEQVSGSRTQEAAVSRSQEVAGVRRKQESGGRTLNCWMALVTVQLPVMEWTISYKDETFHKPWIASIPYTILQCRAVQCSYKVTALHHEAVPHSAAVCLEGGGWMKTPHGMTTSIKPPRSMHCDMLLCTILYWVESQHSALYFTEWNLNTLQCWILNCTRRLSTAQ